MEKQTNSKSIRKWLFIFLQIVIVFLSIAVGYFGHHFILRYRGEWNLLRQAHDILLDNTILAVPEDPALEYGMIEGMLAALEDPYTYFVEPAAHEVQSDQFAGSFGGIGARLARDTEMNWRLYPLPDSSALAAGIKDGDMLIAVDQLAVTSETDETTLLAALRGPVDEEVTLIIQRNGGERTFTIQRQEVALPSVTWNALPEAPHIGMLQINRIADSTAEEIQNGLTDLTAQDVEAVILDLRNNGGGLVDAAVDIARLFLDDGEILHQQFKDQDEQIFRVEEPGLYTNLPLVVLVNGNTASSAEIVAGVLKGHQRAEIIGAPTYGKTTIQYIFDLLDDSSIHVTSGEWWISGVNFPLQPDIMISEDPTGIHALKAAIEVLENQIN